VGFSDEAEAAKRDDWFQKMKVWMMLNIFH